MNYTDYSKIRGLEENTNIEGRMIRIALDRRGKIYREKEYNPFQYVYAIAAGGFGCQAHSLGNAIFTHHEGSSERDVLNKLALNVGKTDRWEAYWPNLQVADLPEGQVIKQEGQ